MNDYQIGRDILDLQQRVTALEHGRPVPGMAKSALSPPPCEQVDAVRAQNVITELTGHAQGETDSALAGGRRSTLPVRHVQLDGLDRDKLFRPGAALGDSQG